FCSPISCESFLHPTSELRHHSAGTLRLSGVKSNFAEVLMLSWFATTLRQYPEIAIFLALALGYYFGKFTFRGLGLGSVTATLLAGVLIGQIGITIAQPLKATVFLLFLFAVGYGVGPQFVRGVAKDGVPQALFAVV